MPRPSVNQRCAGFVVPLFSVRSARDAGIGEILDLVPLLQWGASFGQRVVQLLPINETAPGEASPYNALSAFAIDPVYLSVHAVPHAPPVSAVAPSGARLPREAIRDAKLRALAAAFEHFQREHRDRGPRSLGAFVDANRDWLDDYALFHALKEEHEFAPWEQWPAALRARSPAALARAARRFGHRIEFLRYVQWLAARQWTKVHRAAAAAGVWLKGDLPFVLGRDSVDVWVRQDEFDSAYSVGAPPDDFSSTGQSWNLPLYDWPRVRMEDFAWWRRRASHAATFYDLFRIDHIIGFFRTYAMPVDPALPPRFVPDTEPAQREQGEAFLRAMIDASNGARPMAEDLGTVPDWVRQCMHRLGVPGYKVFRWEREHDRYRDPRSYDPLSVATTGTHDTDTLVEWWAGLDAEERTRVLVALRIESTTDQPGLSPGLREQMLARLYKAGSAWVIVPIQDLFGWRDRINVPATPSHLNWNWRMPVTIEHLADDPAIARATAAIAAAVAAAGRSVR